MNIEQLTKHQIVLLALLVSFVSSAVTGIVTVSLMDQAPQSVTRTINQIVEHTVEKVVPATQGAAVVTTKTVVVKDDDLTTQSIGAAQKGVIRIVAKGGTELIARGIILDTKGTALTDRAALADSGVDSFMAILASGEWVPLKVRASTGTTTPFAIVDVAVGTSTGFAPVVLTNVTKLRLGQSVIRIGGKGLDTVGSGVLASLPSKVEAGSLVEASVTSATPGSILITLFGEVVAMATTDSLTNGSDFYTIPSATIPQAVSTVSAPKTSAGQ